MLTERAQPAPLIIWPAAPSLDEALSLVVDSLAGCDLREPGAQLGASIALDALLAFDAPSGAEVARVLATAERPVVIR